MPPGDQASLARQFGQELGKGLQWPDAGEPVGRFCPACPSLNVLLYWLDLGVLHRVSAILGTITPGLKLKISHDHVGSPRLRQQSRQAEVIVLATR